MIQYRQINPDYPIIVPVLHKVYFSKYHQIPQMREWLEANCQADYYVSPGWTDNFVQFEDDVDATAFALRWS